MIQLLWHPGDGSEFYIEAEGRTLDTIKCVAWRNLALDADGFIEQLDDTERDDLESDLRNAADEAGEAERYARRAGE